MASCFVGASNLLDACPVSVVLASLDSEQVPPMRFLAPIRLAVISAGLLVCPGLSVAQSERIVDFHSDITLEADSTLQVTETITLIAAGIQIRHGI